MAEKFDELLDEVQSDIRQERLKELWVKYGQKISAVFVAAMAIGAGYTFWQNYQTSKRHESSAIFIKAQELLSQGEIDKAVSVLQDLKQGNGIEYPVLAQFLAAAALLQDSSPENMKKALAEYKELGVNTKIDISWRELAQVLALSLEMDIEGEVKYDDMLTRLEPLTVKGASWYHLAMELKGAILHQKGEMTKAAEIFADLASDKDAPEGVRTRAQLMAQVLTAEVSG